MLLNLAHHIRSGEQRRRGDFCRVRFHITQALQRDAPVAVKCVEQHGRRRAQGRKKGTQECQPQGAKDSHAPEVLYSAHRTDFLKAIHRPCRATT